MDYNIAFVNSEYWLANFLYISSCYIIKKYKTFFPYCHWYMQLYQHSWKLEKLEIMWKHSAFRASCFHTISRFPNSHSCWYNCMYIKTENVLYLFITLETTYGSCVFYTHIYTLENIIMVFAIMVSRHSRKKDQVKKNKNPSQLPKSHF